MTRISQCGGPFPAQRERKSSVSARKTGHAGSSASRMWFELSSTTKRLFGMSEASSRPCSRGGRRSLHLRCGLDDVHPAVHRKDAGGVLG